MKRTAFFISDGTGLTAEALGHALLAQFEKIDFERITVPYIDDEEKAHDLVKRINKAAEVDGAAPLVLDTIVNSSIREIISTADGFMIDIFGTFLSPLEQELNSSSSYTVGKSHAINNEGSNDDGARTRHYSEADLILVGASRSGKTPTCLYLALQYGIKAANYPITEEDLEDQKLPAALRPHKEKIFGLTIEPERLATIRNERRPNSRYSSIQQCMHEIEEIELMYKRERIPYLNTTAYSVEEISTRIMVTTGLKRHR
jgi:[pyruvate, water dikinase]-phosphate phosphotransferase / [pyruvate, water dikinase] kinase